jgi:hypothetical protein
MTLKAVTVPVDAGLARLLRQAVHDHATSPETRRNLGILASTAERLPAAGARSAQLQVPMAQAVAGDLSRALRRAREVSDLAADVLAEFLADQFGVTEGEQA